MRASLDISKANLGQAKDHPIIRPSDFVKALDKHNRLDLLLPASGMESSMPILQEYWQRFRKQFGSDHEVFTSVPEEFLQFTIPCKFHGDEGRSIFGDDSIFLGASNL